jgi:hypothetical protein
MKITKNKNIFFHIMNILSLFILNKNIEIRKSITNWNQNLWIYFFKNN